MSDILKNKSNSFIEQKLVGALLGVGLHRSGLHRSGWLERKSPTSNTRFRFEQSLKHSQRFYNLYNYFALMCAGNVMLRERLDKRNNSTYSTLHFSTRSLPFFNPFYDIFYKDKKKVVLLLLCK